MGDSYNPNVGSPLPELFCALDYNDGGLVANQATIVQYENCVSHRLAADRSFKRSCRPVPATVAFSSGMAGTGFGTPKPPYWINTSVINGGANVLHFGMKFYFRNWFIGAVGAGNGIRIIPTLYFRVKEAH